MQLTCAALSVALQTSRPKRPRRAHRVLEQELISMMKSFRLDCLIFKIQKFETDFEIDFSEFGHFGGRREGERCDSRERLVSKSSLEIIPNDSEWFQMVSNRSKSFQNDRLVSKPSIGIPNRSGSANHHIFPSCLRESKIEFQASPCSSVFRFAILSVP